MKDGHNYIEDISEALVKRHASVMVGSGFSKNADKVTISKSSFLDWKQLSDLFYDKVYGNNINPGKEYISSIRLAQEVEVIAGRPCLENIIKKAVPDHDYAPSNTHKALMELQWNDVFTTNYDTLLERATELVTKRRYNVVVCQEDLVNSNEAPRIIKLHGSFPSHRPFIITEEDYRTYPTKSAAMVNTVQQALLENVFCMIGFSCEDPNFINWIGWIHDHLGKSSSQKLYMISVSHISEVKQKMLFDRNIIVIDLEDLWPMDTLHERIDNFLAEIKKHVETKEKQKMWFEVNDTLARINAKEFSERTLILQNLRLNYPGWIFLPWNLRSKALYIIDSLWDFDKLKHESIFHQINYIYEYVLFSNLVGRLLDSHISDIIWEILSRNNWDTLEIYIESLQELRYKSQVILLQILRSFREHANYEKYAMCHKMIQLECLTYDDKQFLYSEECRYCLFRFEATNLSRKLETWELANSDVYWPLIKASLLVQIGNINNAKNTLLTNLINIRKQLTKDSTNSYLSSIEESVISLINFLNQSEFREKHEFEIHTHEENLSWWDENDKYVLHLLGEFKEQSEFSTTYNFNLSVTHSKHNGKNNKDFLIAAEYWRFLELTGHVFRIGNVVSFGGLEGSLKRLHTYYPHWSLMQILSSQEGKYIDLLYGRYQLAFLSAVEVNHILEEYLNIFSILIDQVRPRNNFSCESIYDYAAGVLPSIIARLCYKCSLDMLDKVLDILLELCLGDNRFYFKKLNELIRGVISAYSSEQQYQRLERILIFPIASDRVNDYFDPIQYIKVPDKQQQLDTNLYNKVISHIKTSIESNDRSYQDAITRLIVLNHLVLLQESDKQYLYDLLQNSKFNKLEYYYHLYYFKAPNINFYLSAILNETKSLMENDSNPCIFSSRMGDYQTFINVVGDIFWSDEEIINLFNVMIKLVESMGKLIKKEAEAEARIQQTVVIAEGVILSFLNNQKNEIGHLCKEILQKYKDTVYEVLGKQMGLEICYNIILQKEEMVNEDVNNALWQYDKKALITLNDFLQQINNQSIDIITNINLYKQLCENSKIIIYRLMSSDLDYTVTLLKLLYNYLKCGCIDESIRELLVQKLQLLYIDTLINSNDSEETAIQKTGCRFLACELAASLFKLCDNRNIPEIIDKWKEVSTDENEMVEIRNVRFEF